MCERSFFSSAFPAARCGDKLSGSHCMRFWLVVGQWTRRARSGHGDSLASTGSTLPVQAEKVLCIRNHTVRLSIPSFGGPRNRDQADSMQLAFDPRYSHVARHTAPAQFGRRVCVGGLSPGYPTMCWRSGTAVRIQQELARSSRTPPAADFHRRCREPTSEHLHAPGRSRRGVSDEPLATGGAGSGQGTKLRGEQRSSMLLASIREPHGSETTIRICRVIGIETRC